MHVARGWEPRPLSCQRCSGQCPEPQGAGREWGHRGLEAKRQFCFVGEEIEITFSYWDGSGHRRTVKVTLRGLRPVPHAPRPSGPASIGLGGKELSIPTEPSGPLVWVAPGGSGGAGRRVPGFRPPFPTPRLVSPHGFPLASSRVTHTDEKGQHDAAVPAEGPRDPAQRLQRAQVGLRGRATGCTGVCSLSPGARDPRWQLLLAARWAPRS